jgi:hypothetical protein
MLSWLMYYKGNLEINVFVDMRISGGWGGLWWLSRVWWLIFRS